MEKLKDYIKSYLLIAYFTFVSLIPLVFGFVGLTDRLPKAHEFFLLTIAVVTFFMEDFYKLRKNIPLDTKEM